VFPGATTGPAGHDGDDKARGNSRRLLRVVNVIGVVALALNTVGGCGSNKNYDQREAVAATLPDDGKAGIWADEADGCLGQCQRDPGSPLQDCAAEEAGLEFLSITGWDFQGLVANSLYSYTDKSAHNLQPVGWEPPTAAMSRCFGATTAEKGLHMRGGPFRDWGGGFGVRLELGISVDPSTPCSDPVNRAEYCPPIGTEPPLDTRAFDLTRWDGVSFWARRGPDGQPLLRVMIADRRTDDDVSFLMSRDVPEEPRFCERNLKCSCPEDLPCTEVPADKLDKVNNDCLADWQDRVEQGATVPPFTICWDPVADPDLTKQARHTTCGSNTCDCPYEAFAETQDPLFAGRGCNEFAFRGGIVNDYCYNPGQDPDPYEGNYLCGDHWASPVSLTTDWQFFKVPFTSLLQQGWAKEQHEFDLQYVTGLRFTWDKGIIDYYIDDVRFYREQPGN